jgi:hypothetical protein
MVARSYRPCSFEVSYKLAADGWAIQWSEALEADGWNNRTMPEQRSFIETLTPRARGAATIGTISIRATVADASFLVSDILRATRTRQQGPFLDALKSGVVRTFVAHQVWAEVPRSVRRAAAEQHLDPTVAEQIWWREYIPLIRVVEVEGIPTVQAESVLSRDRSDVPTMQLAGLLAPVVVLASDRDLQDPGIATQKYFQVVDAAGSLTVVAEGTWVGMVAMNAAGVAAQSAVRGVAALARRREGQLVLAGLAGAAVVGALVRRTMLRDDARRLGHRFGAVLWDRVVPFMESMAMVYENATKVWEGGEYRTEGGTVQQQVARALSVSPHPLNRTQLAEHILPDGSDADRRRLVRDLASVLEAVPAFSRVSLRGWELGRAGVDFGGFGDPAPKLLEIDALRKTRHLRAALESRQRKQRGQRLIQ